MKRSILLALIAIIAVPAHAQEQDNLQQLLTTDLRSQKVSIFGTAMNLKGPEKKPFWKIYNEYDKEHRALYQEKFNLLVDYAENYEAMAENKAKELAEKLLDIQQRNNQLSKKYFHQVEKELNSIIAMRFLQVVNRYNTLRDLQLTSRLPLIQ